MTLRQPTAAAGSIVFRTDAALQIGAGHVMRCLTLADALKAAGWQCHFICRAHPGHLGALIEQRGHTLHLLPRMEAPAISQATTGPAHAHWLGTDAATDAAQTAAILQPLLPDWLVVDHYALDATWQRQLRPLTRRILVIDDLADRPHDADLLLDQNLGSTAEAYSQLVPASCKLLIGPHYALLRSEFATLRSYSIKRRSNPSPCELLITMGGVDNGNATGLILNALRHCTLPKKCRITVVMGSTAPWLENVRELAQKMPWPTQVVVSASNMAQRMAESDIAIGAAGSTSWELCCLGVPSLLICVATNQLAVISALASKGAAVPLDIVAIQKQNSASFRLQYEKLVNNLEAYSNAAITVTDGDGAARVRALMI